MELNKKKKGPGDIKQLNWPENVLCNPEYMIGSLTPEASGKPCEGACNAFREIIDNAIDVTYENPDATTIIVDTENYGGYNLVADNSWGIPIKMSEVPGKTMAHLSISSLNSGSKFSISKDNDVASIGRHGVGSAVSCALSEEYILLSKITSDNYNQSIPEVKQLWESQGPRSKKDLFYVVVYKDYGKLAFEGAMKLADLNAKLGVNLPCGMSTIVLFRLGTQHVPDPRVVIPYDNLNYFLLIMREFYKRKVTVIANGVQLENTEINSYKYRILKTITPEDTSKNKEVKVLIYFDVDPELSPKSSCGSVNGLVVNTGLHINYIESCYEQALKSEFKITHRYTMNGFRSCVVLLAEAIGFDSQTKVRLKSIGKVKLSDFSGALVKEFQKIFKSDPEYWAEHVGKLNFLAESMRSLSTDERVAKMIDDSKGGSSFYKSKNSIVEGYAAASAGPSDRWGCELFLCFTGNTEVLTTEGPVYFIDLVERIEKGEELYTYTFDGQEDVVSRIIAAKKIKEASKVVTVTLGNGDSFRCTPDHKIMLANGEYKEAGDLEEGIDTLRSCFGIAQDIYSIKEENTRESVYCLEVDHPEHNFSLAAGGVFVKNCEGLSPFGSLKSARIDIKHTGVLALRGKVKNLSKSSNGIESLLDNKEYYSIFKVLNLGVGDSSVIKGCKTREEAYEVVKRYANYSSVIIATDADEDGLSIQSGLLYTFSKFARFMIEFGMIKIAESPVYIQGNRFFYPSDPLVPGTRFPVGLDLNKDYKHIKGLGSLNKDEATKSFFDPSTRRLITVTLEGLDYSMGLVENISERKKLLFDSGILSNPYGFTDL